MASKGGKRRASNPAPGARRSKRIHYRLASTGSQESHQHSDEPQESEHSDGSQERQQSEGSQGIQESDHSQGSQQPRDGDSELSELSKTPTPPPELEPPRVECTHILWCDCPMHTSYTSDTYIPHLSSWALSGMRYPESNERGAVNPVVESNGPEAAESDEPGATESNESESPISDIRDDEYYTTGIEVQRRRAEAQRWSEWVTEALPKLDPNDPNSEEYLAKHFVNQVNTEFPALVGLRPDSNEENSPPPAIERVAAVIYQWGQDKDWQRLQRDASIALQHKKELVLLFQAFLPQRVRKAKKEIEGLVTPPKEKEKAYWEGFDELEASRKKVEKGKKRARSV